MVFLCRGIFSSVSLIHRYLCSFAAQIALASGATVIMTSSSDAKLEVAKALGAQYLINYNKNPNWEDEVLEIVSRRGSLVAFQVTNHPMFQD